MSISLSHSRSRWEEPLNTISHGLTALTAIGGFVVLVVYGASSEKNWTLFSSIIYGLCLIILYAASATYHGVARVDIKDKLRIVDHCSIFLLIAGTYTPILLVAIGGVAGWVLFGLQWGLAFSGIIMKIFYAGKYEVASLLSYLVMGWMILVKVETLYHAVVPAGFWLIMAGGLAYSAGTIFYVLDKRIPFGHFIWHLFVIAGSLLHYLAIVLFVIN